MNQKLTELIESIKQPEFHSDINIASSFRVAISIVEKHPVIKNIYALINNQEDIIQLKDCFIDLLKESSQQEYLSNWDVTLFSFLFLIQKKDPVTSVEFAKKAINSKNLWWTRKFSEIILQKINSEIIVNLNQVNMLKIAANFQGISKENRVSSSAEKDDIAQALEQIAPKRKGKME